MLRRYHSIQDLVRDLRKLRRAASESLAAIKEHNMRDADNLEEGLPPVSQRIRKTGDLSKRGEQRASKASKQLHLLLQQQVSVRNIINSLQTEFAKGDDKTDVNRMRTLARRVSADIEQQIEQLKQSATEETNKTVPPLLLRLANNVGNKIDQELSRRYAKRELVTLSAPVPAASGGDAKVMQYSVYLIYHQVHTDAGYIIDQMVFVLSLVGETLYINPALHAIKVPGQFRVGFALRLSDKSALADLTKEVMQRVNAELETHDHLARTAALPMPVDINRLKLSNFPGVVRSRMDGNILKVELDKAVDEKLANETANQIYRTIYSAAIAVMPKIRISRVIRKLREGNWQLQFVFIPAGKLSGRTMGREMVDSLRGLGLLDNEISQIRHIIES